MKVPARLVPVAILALVAAVVVLVVLHPMRPPGGSPAATGNATAASSPSTAPSEGQPAGSEADQWHGVMENAGGDFCARCHASPLMEFYKASWSRAPGGWTLTVAPTFPDVALLSVEADAKPLQGQQPQTADNPAWAVGTVWNGTFQVPAGTTNVSVLLEAGVSTPNAGTLTDGTAIDNQTASTGLGSHYVAYEADPGFVLVAPDGARFESHRLESFRALAEGGSAVPGTWSFQALVPSATLNGAPLAALHGSLSVLPLQGNAAGLTVEPSYAAVMKAKAPAAATLWFAPESDGGPPSVNLRAFPFHDHSDERGEYDPSYDLGLGKPYLRVFGRQAGPLFLPDPPSPSALDQIWGGRTSYTLWQWNLTLDWAYATDGQGVPHGYGDFGQPRDYPAMGNLLAGAKRLAITANWTPAIDVPDLAAKVSPGNSPDWFVAPTLVSSAPGSRTWSIDADPAWWDTAGSGYWCATLYRPLVPNTVYSGGIQAHVTVVAER